MFLSVGLIFLVMLVPVSADPRRWEFATDNKSGFVPNRYIKETVLLVSPPRRDALQPVGRGPFCGRHTLDKGCSCCEELHTR